MLLLLFTHSLANEKPTTTFYATSSDQTNRWVFPNISPGTITTKSNCIDTSHAQQLLQSGESFLETLLVGALQLAAASDGVSATEMLANATGEVLQVGESGVGEFGYFVVVEWEL